MRREPIAFGLGLVATAVGITVAIWDTHLDPQFAERADELNTGMTHAEVSAVMGSRGEEEGVFVSGPPKYWARHFQENDLFTRRWEDPEATVKVHFSGPKGRATATSISCVRKAHPNHGAVWATGILLSLPALGGVVLVVFGLCVRSSQSAAGVPSSPPSA
jgi:hypothetical protein